MSVIDYSWDFSREEFSLDLDFFNEKEQEDKLWQARTGLNHETLCGAIETIIFMNDKPVNLLKIKNLIDTDLPLRVVHEAIARLQAEYEAKHHGIRLMEVAQGYQFRTKATYSKIVQSMYKVQSLQLSPTALEVMAMIAYKQPISKTQVESIRGVDSSHVIRALMDRRLVRIVGRSDEVGKPSLYGTTPEFLEVFNLNTIDDLPTETELEEIANANEVGQISDIKNIVKTGDRKKFDMDELLELDQLSSSIQDIASDTMFTKSLKDMEKVRKSEEGVEKKSAFDILEEYVSKAQIIEANKSSIESEVLTSVMEPKAVSVHELLEGILNAPEMDEDELDIEVELEAEEYSVSLKDDDGQLPVGESDFEELDSSEVHEIEAKADDVLEKSNELLESITADEPEVAEPEMETGDLDIASFISSKIASASVKDMQEDAELAEDQAEVEAKASLQDMDEEDLAAALDAAFDNLTFDESANEMAEDVAVEEAESVRPEAESTEASDSNQL